MTRGIIEGKVKGPRNPAGGLKAPLPGGYERQWGKLIGVGTWGRPHRR